VYALEEKLFLDFRTMLLFRVNFEAVFTL